jgi:hypothetical protein
MPRTKKDAQHFLLPDGLPTESKHTGKAFSEYTLKVYQQKLDKLVASGINNASDLAQNQDKAIQIAQQETKGESPKMRQYLSAMFYALSSLPNESKTKLYDEFQKHKSDVHPVA